MKKVIDEHTANSPLTVRRRKVRQALKEVQKGARARTLDEDQVDAFYFAYRSLRDKARREDIPLEDLYVRISGGGVSSSYGYSAKTTRIEVKNGRLVVERGSAPTSGKDQGTITGGFKGRGRGGIRTLN